MTYSNHLPVTRPKSFTAPLWRGIIVQEASNTFLPTWAQLGWPNQWSLLVSFPEFQAAERLALYFAEGAAYDKSKCSKESLQHIPLSFFMFNPHFLWLTQFPCTSILLQKNPWKKRYITQQARRSPRATELWVPSWNKRKCSRKGM